MSLAQAVKKTFSGEMCSVCVAVQAAKQQQDADNAKTPGAKLTGKLLVLAAPARLHFLAPTPSCAGLTPAVSVPLSAEPATPPSPPPRALA
jgi:hypothetical protein